MRVFLRRFETSVEAMVGVSDQQKYEELKHWTKGKANTYVQSMKDRPPTEALMLAKQRLISFFAAIPRTAHEIFEPLKKGKAISVTDKDAYQLFLCELEATENGCFINRDAHLLNTVELIIDLVASRMPKLQKEFSKYAKRIYQAGGVITFFTLKNFVGEQITDLSMPCSSIAFEKRIAESKSSSSSSSSSSTAKKPPDPKPKKPEKASIAAAETSESSASSSPQPSKGNEGEGVKRKGRAACAACKQMHNLFNCEKFKEMSPLKRKQFCYQE